MIAAAEKRGIRMTGGPDLSILAKGRPGVPMVEAIRLACAARATIPSNKRLTELFMLSDVWAGMTPAFPCRSGTMVGYVQAGKTFREQTDRISLLGNQHFIVYTDSQTSIRYLFPVSDEHLDRKDALLAVNHPDFELVRDGMDWVVTVADPTRIGLVERFPRSGGWYAADEKYDIPQGSDRGRMDPRQPDTSLRFLLRGFDWVGLAIRAPLSFQTYEVKQRVLLDTMPSAGFGLITETQVKP